MRAIWAAFFGMIIYVLIAISITPALEALYADPQQVYFPLTHFNDGAKYVAICTQGYGLPMTSPIQTLGYSRTAWMPIYPFLQCVLRGWQAISMVTVGFYISLVAAGISLFLGALTLSNLNVKLPALHTYAAFIPPIGAAWIFMSGAETTYLAESMFLMWLLTSPMPESSSEVNSVEWLRTLIGMPLGVILVLTKPNALQLLLPLGFAFVWLSWRRSKAIGYPFGPRTFLTDILVEHIALPLALLQRLRRVKSSEFESRPMVYDWMPATVIMGILLGFAFWQFYSSDLNGVPFYGLQQQLVAWSPQWNSGNLIRMIQYFSTAFNGASREAYWRVNAAWYLAANLMPLIPAASRRVPTVIRGMLVCMPFFLLISGQVNGTDRHLVSTGLVAIGLGCWLAPTGKAARWAVARWAFLIVLASINVYLMLFHMYAIGGLGLTPFRW